MYVCMVCTHVRISVCFYTEIRMQLSASVFQRIRKKQLRSSSRVFILTYIHNHLIIHMNVNIYRNIKVFNKTITIQFIFAD